MPLPGARPPPVRHRRNCAVCGQPHALRLNGRIHAHRQARVGPAGRYLAEQRCPGSGQPPEDDLFQTDREEHP
jgi:hypothetical protein